MSNKVISVENLSKSYQLGQIGTGTLSHDLEVWWARLRGKPNPLLKIGEKDHGNRQGETLWALRDVNFTVEQGQVLGIIGRNGAGKSTLLKILSRVTAPTSGLVKVKGRMASLLEVGTGFHPELSGRENIFLNGAILGMSNNEVKRKLDEIVAFAEVDKFLDTPVKRYSSGMYVRLAFAVAAHLDPEILIVDEVLAVGDAEFQKKCLGKMGDVAKEGRTVLFVSHNMAAIRQLCPTCILINQGMVGEIGRAEPVIQKYLNRGSDDSYIVEFSSKPSNFNNNLIRFCWIQIKNSNHEYSKAFMVGDDVIIVFKSESLNQITDYKVVYSILLKSSDGISIANCHNTDSSFSMKNHIRSNGIFEVVFKDIRLYPGRYFISLWAGIDGVETYDWKENCMSFDIISGGIKTTRQLKKHDGLIYLTPEWKNINSDG